MLSVMFFTVLFISVSVLTFDVEAGEGECFRVTVQCCQRIEFRVQMVVILVFTDILEIIISKIVMMCGKFEIEIIIF